MPTPGVIEYPAALDTALSLIEVANNGLSTLTAGISVSDLLIPVAEPGKFPNSGFVTLVDSLTAPTKIEIAIYTSKSGSNLVVPSGGRGAQGTTAFAFSTGNFVDMRPTARHHTALADLLIAIEQKLGIGADTPGAAVEALFSNGAGASQWRSIVAGDLPNLPISQITSLQAALDGKQPLDADLTAIAALATDGFLRKLSGVWQMSNPQTAFSLSFGIADPSTPTVDAVIPGTISWLCPVGSNVLINRVHVKYESGSHTPGGSVTFAIQRRQAANGWATPVTLFTISLDNTNNAPFTVYTNDVVDTPMAAGDTLIVFIDDRSGLITERDVSVILQGTQQVF